MTVGACTMSAFLPRDTPSTVVKLKARTKHTNVDNKQPINVKGRKAMLDKKARYYLDKATKLAEKGTYRRARHGAIIVKNGRIIARGINKLRTSAKIIGQEQFNRNGTLHAEISAMRQVSPENLRGATIFIARILRNGEQAMSKPCPRCLEAIKKAGIKRIYYTIESVIDLENERIASMSA